MLIRERIVSSEGLALQGIVLVGRESSDCRLVAILEQTPTVGIVVTGDWRFVTS